MAERPGARPRLLVLGAGPAQLGLLGAARARGVHVIAADRDPRAVGFELADERAVISSEDEPALERLARVRQVDGIVSPGSDWPVGVAARIAERLGLAHPVSAAVAGLSVSKSRQRERLAGHGVPQPRVFPGVEQATLPCVVKAADRQGQRGLTLVRTPDALEAALAHALAESRSGTVLVEELVEGPELTVNGVWVAGAFVPLTVTDRLLAPEPAFGVALAHAWPSRHAVGEAVEVAAAASRALGQQNGPSYVQVRLGADGPRVMEVALRLGGGHDAELCEAALGVDLNALAVDFALGRRVALPDVARGAARGHVLWTDRGEEVPAELGEPGPLPSSRGMSQGLSPVAPRSGQVGGACVVFLVAPEGTLRDVRGVERAAATEGVRWVRVYRRPGWRFGSLRRGADRAGAILAVGDSRDDALDRARRAASLVRFDVDAGET